MLHSSPVNNHRGASQAQILRPYDTGGRSTMSSISAAPNEILRLTTPNGLQMVGGMDSFGHDLNFEADGLVDDANTSALPPMPFTPSYELDSFQSTFDDPFSYHPGADFSSLLEDNKESLHNESTNSGVNLDNKLLGFGSPILKAPIFDNGGQTWPSMSAELYGMFFVAEDVFGDNTNPGRPAELTCYRRNLFQISGTMVLSRGIKSMINEQGQHIPIYNLTATLSAIESIEGKNTEIISVPWKTSTGISSEEKAGTTPPTCPLDLSMNPELDPSIVSIPIGWKRLQFKHATANNGRRKGLQQHYIVQINLVATLATGESVKLAEIQSGAIIVRGRSPRNFDSRKDVPLTDKKVEPKQRTSSDASATVQQVKVDPGVTNSSYRFYNPNTLQQPLDLLDWTSPSLPTPSSPSDPRQRQTKRPTLTHQSSSSISRPPVPKTTWKPGNSANKSVSATTPIDLSLADDEYGRPHSNSTGSSGRLGDSASPVLERHKLGKKGVGSPVEEADLLYEYFPLSVDDWMPPVDAIYRPHVVHHTIIPPDLKAQQVKNKTKRYFSADD